MKNIIKLSIISVVALLSLSACERMVDYTTTIDAYPHRIYSNSFGEENIDMAKITHAPIGSFCSFSKVMPLNANTGNHGTLTVEAVYDEQAAQAYISKTASKAKVLPAEYLRIVKYVKDDLSTEPSSSATITIPEGLGNSADSLYIMLSGDLTKLTELEYIAAVSISSADMATSEVKGTYYLQVLTEKNCIKQIESQDDVMGFNPSDYSGMEYIEGLSGNINENHRVSTQETVTVAMDLKNTYLISGLAYDVLYSWDNSPTISAIMYSEDNTNWEQAGSPEGKEYINDNSTYVAFYGFIKARYLKFTIDATQSYYGHFNNFRFFYMESENPMIYLADGDFKGQILHNPAGTEGNMNVELNVKNTIPTSKAISVSASVDNSLISSYNAAHGTAYESINTSNINIEGNVVIAPNASEGNSKFKITLTGDLSGYTSDNSYLIPVTVSTSDAEVSKTKSVAYIVVEQKTVYLRSNFVESQIGAPALQDKSGWSIEGTAPYWGNFNDVNGLIDGDVSAEASWYSWDSYPNWTITLDKEYDFYGVAVFTVENYGISLSDFEIAISTDGSNFKTLGTASAADGSRVDQGTKAMSALFKAEKAKYVKITYMNTYFDLSEIDIYAK